jgi:hypothetical protein
MARTRKIGVRSYKPRRVAYRMTNSRKFYEKQPRKFPYGILPYVQPTYWISGYCEDD